MAQSYWKTERRRDIIICVIVVVILGGIWFGGYASRSGRYHGIHKLTVVAPADEALSSVRIAPGTNRELMRYFLEESSEDLDDWVSLNPGETKVIHLRYAMRERILTGSILEHICADHLAVIYQFSDGRSKHSVIGIPDPKARIELKMPEGWDQDRPGGDYPNALEASG